MNRAPQDLRDRVEKFMERLEAQERLYRELKAVSDRQIGELARNTGPTLDILAEQKSRILEKIEMNDAETAGEYQKLEPHLDTLSDSVRLKLELTRLKTSEALKEALEAEECGGERAKVQIEKINENLAEVNRARRIAEKYKPLLRGEDEPKFFDERQ